MNSHIVPRTYLKSWIKENTNESIDLFSKDELNHIGNFNISKKMKLEFVAKNFYKLNPDIEYHKKWIENNDLKVYKDPLNKIEDALCEYIENKWNYFLETLKGFISQKCNKERMTQNQEILIEFFAIQYCRRYENFYPLLQKAKNGLITITRSNPDAPYHNAPEEQIQAIHNTEFDNLICFNQLCMYFAFKNSLKNDYIDNIITKTINTANQQMRIVFLVSESMDFITSDNPVTIHKNDSEYNQYFGGWFLPLMKNVCAWFFLERGKRIDAENKHTIMNINSKNTKYINYLTSQFALQYLVYSDKDIRPLISNVPDITNWKREIERIGYVFINLD
jgi:hypothetical protein